MDVAKIEEALRAEVLKVCRFCCLQVWNEALDQAGVEASSALRRAKNVNYPPTIRASGSKVDSVSKEDADNEASTAKILPSSNSPRKDTKQAKALEKVKDTLLKKSGS